MNTCSNQFFFVFVFLFQLQPITIYITEYAHMVEGDHQLGKRHQPQEHQKINLGLLTQQCVFNRAAPFN